MGEDKPCSNICTIIIKKILGANNNEKTLKIKLLINNKTNKITPAANTSFPPPTLPIILNKADKSSFVHTLLLLFIFVQTTIDIF